MSIGGGYAGKVLRVDLTRGTVRTEPLPDEETLRRYIGGSGLALYYLLKETPAAAQPTDPGTPLIFMTGPLAGTSAPSSANWVVCSLHYEVPYAAGLGHGHGYWAAYLKHAGYEGIIVTGQSPRPVYLWVDDDRVALRGAEHLWGKDTRETERLVKTELGGDPEQISVASIGPGGEALMYGASIKTDRNHGAGKGSPGAIMGSKRLKAIAVRGTGRVPVARLEPFLETVAEWEGNIDPPPEKRNPNMGAGFWLKDGGITQRYTRLGDVHRVAFKNLLDPLGGQEYARRYVEACSRWKVTPRGSFNCPIKCAYDVAITDGPYAGLVASLCGGGENTEGAAGLIGILDPATALAMTDHYDALGLESSTFGCVLGMAFEAYNKGLITKEDTGGLELTWGNHEAALSLIDQTLKRKGLGALLAQGLKGAAGAIARRKEPAGELLRELSSMTIHVKGTGINLHDWRPFWSFLFGQFIASAGPGHQAQGADLYADPELGVQDRMKSPADSLEEALAKIPYVRRSQVKKLWEDCLGVCWFACWGVQDVIRLSSQALGQAVGWDDFTPEEALAVGDRVVNLMRLVYARRGFTKADEFDISPRLLDGPPAGRAEGRTLAPFLADMVDEYYRLMGWDVDTGLPPPELLKRLGIEEFA
jgi:aldehyde:ferredoxin oxidoreductase